LELIGKVKTESGPFAANNLIGVLSSFFRWSLSQAIITSSPLEAVQKSKEVKGVRSLSDAELKSIWLSCDQIHPVFRDAIRMLTLSGCRRDEVATMEWSHVDFGNKRWTIPEVKNRKPHTVHLTPAMLDILEKRPRIGVSRYVFTTTGDSPISGFSKVKKIIDCEVKIPEWRFHDFRRTITDGLIKLGVAFEVRERVLSHTLKGVAASYTTHTFEKEMAAAWTLWSDHVTATVAVRKSNLVPIRA
jgi:integrase